MKGWEVTPVDEVDVTYKWGGWMIVATWPARTGRADITSLIRIRYLDELVHATTRINVLSSSQINQLGVVMRRYTEEKDDIHRLLQHVVEDLISWYRRGTATTYPEPKLRDSGGWLIYPVWPSTGITAVAAAPSSYKSVLAQALALQLATGTELLEGNTRPPRTETRTLFLDWEADEGTFGERLHGLYTGAGLPPESRLAYKQMRIPLVDAASGLADEIQRGRFGAVVIDSMSAAAGGDLVDAAVVNGFYDAARLLNVPALVLAHKSAENIKSRSARFFGSIMSEARVRLAWNAERATDSDLVLWSVFKDNNLGRHGMRLAWRMGFTGEGTEEDERLTTIRVEGVNPDDVNLKANEGDTVKDRMYYALIERGPLMTAELAKAIGKPESTIRTTTSRHSDLFTHTNDGRWSIRDTE